MPRGQLRPDRHACKHARCRESFCGGPRSGSGNPGQRYWRDRKSTRLNSSHIQISYAVFCLKKKIMDVPTGFRSDPARARWTVDETVRRADQAMEAITREDILWMGPVQGGVHIEEVKRSAREMVKRDFPIYALGSPTELLESQRYDVLVEMIIAAKRTLPKGKPFFFFNDGPPPQFSSLSPHDALPF